MTFNFFDTGGHGYLQVSKEQFLQSGADKRKISTYSGLTQTFLYLEEDCDATYFLNHLRENGISYELNEVYQPVTVTHNYNPNNF